MRDTIRYAVEAGVQSYEFLGRAEAWTKVWTETERPYTLRVYPLGIRGMAALAARAARSYIAGDQLQDAVAVARRLGEQGLGHTYGYWDADGEPTGNVVDEYLAGIDALAGHQARRAKAWRAAARTRRSLIILPARQAARRPGAA